MAIYPHAHYLGKDIKAFATLPDASTLSVLLWVILFAAGVQAQSSDGAKNDVLEGPPSNTVQGTGVPSDYVIGAQAYDRIWRSGNCPCGASCPKKIIRDTDSIPTRKHSVPHS